MQVITAFRLICLVVILIGGGITIYGDRKRELFCLFTGPFIMIIGFGLLIWGLTL